MTRLTFAFLLILPLLASAGEKDKANGFAQQRSAAGTVLMRTDAGGAWTAPELDTPVTKDSLVVTLPGARGSLESKNGAVTLTLAGNLPELSPGPALESAIKLHDPGENDLDFPH